MATSELAQTTLRSVVGQHEFDEMLAERTKINADVQPILNEHTGAWGIKVIDGEGEQQAAEKLAQAGERGSTIIFPMPINLFETLKAVAAAPSKTP